MTEAFDLSMPWWQYVLRACVVYFVLLAMIRVSGKRTMGQFTSFDMLLIVLLGNAVQNALLGTDTSIGGGLLLAGTLMALNWVIGFLTARNDRIERALEGVPVVLARDGHVFHEVLRRELLTSLQALVPHDLGAFHWMQPSRHQIAAWYEPERRPLPSAHREFWRLIESHPLNGVLFAKPSRAWKNRLGSVEITTTKAMRVSIPSNQMIAKIAQQMPGIPCLSWMSGTSARSTRTRRAAQMPSAVETAKATASHSTMRA